jgi:hypothetical protein
MEHGSRAKPKPGSVTTNRDWPMSFPNVCEALGFVPESVRAALLARAAAGETAPGVVPRLWKVQLRRGRRGTGTIGRAQRWAAAS